MLYIWIGTALFDIFVFGINSICYRLDLLIDKKEKLNSFFLIKMSII